MSLTFLMQKYQFLGKKGEGTFSEVLKCQNLKDGSYWACKKMKQHYDSMEQVNNLREIQAMRRLSPHPNILELHEVNFDKKSGTLVLICELMDMNIYEMIKGRRHYVPEKKVKLYMYQLLRSIDHMHRNGIFHRDVKPENVLIKDDLLKLADFGSCRSIYSKQPYTEYISTRWYRAPECLLTDGYYSAKMDIWSVGCVFFEIMSLHPLFPGSNEVDQIAKIHDVMGTPDASVLNKLRNKTRGINFNFPQKKGTGIEQRMPHASQDCVDLIYQMCRYDPEERISSKKALQHSYFKEFRDAEKRARQRRLAQLDINNNTEHVQGVDKEILTDNNNSFTKTAKVEKLTSTAQTKSETSQTVLDSNIQRNPMFRYHRRQQKRHKYIRESETGPNPKIDMYLPKMAQPEKPKTYQPKFLSHSYNSGFTSFPKVGDTANTSVATTTFPTINNLMKPKNKGSPNAAKNHYGRYQLPSLARHEGKLL